MFKPAQLLSKEEIKKIVAIEATAYPDFMQYMQDITSSEDVLEYCESDNVSVALGSDWYIIVSDEEVVDLATSSALSLRDVYSITEALKSFYGTRIFSLDARESTSYKLISLLAKRGKCTIHSEEAWDWDSECMYAMEISIN